MTTVASALTIDVIGEPIPQGSMIPVKRGKRIVLVSDNPRLRAWRATVTAAITARMRLTSTLIHAGPVAVRIDFYLPRPPSVRRRPWPCVRPDVDKMARAVLDALTGTALVDDALVVDLHAVKHYARSTVGARIVVQPVTEGLL